VQTVCPNCGEHYADVPDSYLGRIVECPECGSDFFCMNSADFPSGVAAPQRSINMDKLRCRREKEIRQLLVEENDFRTLWEEWKSKDDYKAIRVHLLASSLRVTAPLSPLLVSIVRMCARIVGIKAGVEIFVRHAPDLNAQCFLAGKRIAVVLNSAIVEKFSPPELAFVIGHEIGHFALRHEEIPNATFLDSRGCSLFQKAGFMAWQRAAEVSADRLGLICCRDWRSAVHCMIKLTSGIASDKVRADAEIFCQQADEIVRTRSKGEKQKGAPFPLAWWLESHPFTCIRAKLLRLFASSSAFSNAYDVSQPQLDVNQLESETERLLSLLDPPSFHPDTTVRKHFREIMLWAMVLTAAADGHIDEREKETIIKHCRGLISRHEVKRVLSQVVRGNIDINRKLREIMSKAASFMPTEVRYKLIEDTVAVAAADGVILPEEERIVFLLATVLSVPRAFVNNLLYLWKSLVQREVVSIILWKKPKRS